MTKENILDTHKEIIEKYWDYEKNNELGYYPENYSKGSHQKVWWKCEECGIIFFMKMKLDKKLKRKRAKYLALFNLSK